MRADKSTMNSKFSWWQPLLRKNLSLSKAIECKKHEFSVYYIYIWWDDFRTLGKFHAWKRDIMITVCCIVIKNEYQNDNWNCITSALIFALSFTFCSPPRTQLFQDKRERKKSNTQIMDQVMFTLLPFSSAWYCEIQQTESGKTINVTQRW